MIVNLTFSVARQTVRPGTPPDFILKVGWKLLLFTCQKSEKLLKGDICFAVMLTDTL